MRLPVTWPWSRGPLASRNFRVLAACNVIYADRLRPCRWWRMPFAVLSDWRFRPSRRGLRGCGRADPDERVPAGSAVWSRTGCPATGSHGRGHRGAGRRPSGVPSQRCADRAGRSGSWARHRCGCGDGPGNTVRHRRACCRRPCTTDGEAAANARTGPAATAASIGGAALGGLLTGLAGPGWALAIDAASYGAAGALLTTMRFPPGPPRHRRVSPGNAQGWREFTSRRWLWLTVAQLTVLVAIRQRRSTSWACSSPCPARRSTQLGIDPRSHLGRGSPGRPGQEQGPARPHPGRCLADHHSLRPAAPRPGVPLTLPLDIAAAFLAGGCLVISPSTGPSHCSRKYPRQNSHASPPTKLSAATPWPRPAPPSPGPSPPPSAHQPSCPQAPPSSSCSPPSACSPPKYGTCNDANPGNHRPRRRSSPRELRPGRVTAAPGRTDLPPPRQER